MLFCMPRDFRLQVFSWISFSLRSFRIFSEICGDNRSSRWTTGVVDTGGKFTACAADTCGNLPPVSLTPATNLPPASSTPAVPVANLLACSLLLAVVHLYLRILYIREFSKKIEMTIMLFSGAWEKIIHEQVSWHCPFKGNFFLMLCHGLVPDMPAV